MHIYIYICMNTYLNRFLIEKLVATGLHPLRGESIVCYNCPSETISQWRRSFCLCELHSEWSRSCVLGQSLGRVFTSNICIQWIRHGHQAARVGWLGSCIERKVYTSSLIYVAVLSKAKKAIPYWVVVVVAELRSSQNTCAEEGERIDGDELHGRKPWLPRKHNLILIQNSSMATSG